MKNIFLILILLSFTCSVSFAAGDLQVGDTAPEWSFSDSEDQSFSMASWPNKVLLVSYVDPDESDVNESFNEALQAARKDGRLQDADYQGVGILDCKATWKPNKLIRAMAGKKAKKYKRIILFDLDATLRESWGFKKDSSNVILLDKNHVVKYISRGKIADGEIASVIQMAIDLQK